MNDRKKLVELVDEYTDHMSVRDFHRVDFSEDFADFLVERMAIEQIWIPVAERRPEPGTLCIICEKYPWNENFSVGIERYNPDISRPYPVAIKYWMPVPPLPEPPKEDGNDRS